MIQFEDVNKLLKHYVDHGGVGGKMLSDIFSKKLSTKDQETLLKIINEMQMIIHTNRSMLKCKTRLVNLACEKAETMTVSLSGGNMWKGKKPNHILWLAVCLEMIFELEGGKPRLGEGRPFWKVRTINAEGDFRETISCDRNAVQGPESETSPAVPTIDLDEQANGMTLQLQDVQILRSVRKDHQCIKQLIEDIKKQVNKIEEELRTLSSLVDQWGRRCRDESSETDDANQHPRKKVALETSSSTSISYLVACTGTTSTLISSAAAAADVQILRSVTKDHQCIKQLKKEINKLKLQVNEIEEELRRLSSLVDESVHVQPVQQYASNIFDNDAYWLSDSFEVDLDSLVQL